MRNSCIMFLILIVLNGCNVNPDTPNYIATNGTPPLNECTDPLNTGKDARNNEILSLLGEYDGSWYISELIAYFFPPDPEYFEPINANDDKYIGTKINIDSTKGRVTFDGDDTYKPHHVSEMACDELSQILFAPRWGLMSDEMAREICGGTYYEESGEYSNHPEGNHVKYFSFESTPKDPKYSEFLSLIISEDGDLLVFIGEAVGTYRLLRE